MLIYCLIIASILIQITTAFLALRLITITGKQLSWFFIAIAMVVQASRRAYILAGLISGKIISSQVGTSELIGLLVSVLMFAGVIGFGSFLVKSFKNVREQKKAEELLAESEEKYRYMFINNPQPMWIYDLETLYFLEVNDAAIGHYGYSREEFLSMTLKDIRPKEDIEALLKDVELTRKIYNPAGEWRHLKKNGELINVEIISHTITFHNRKARHVMVNDITERKLAEQELHVSQELFSEAFQVGPAGMTITRISDGKFMNANESFCKMFEFDLNEVIGHTSTELNMWTPEERKKLIEQQVESGGLQNYELTAHTKSGKPIYLLFSSREMKIKGEMCHLTTLIDITDRERAEELLKKLNEELEFRVFERTSQLEAANKELEAFSYSVSHDLRSPLRHINGFAEILTEQYSDQLPEDAVKHLNTITDAAKKMSTLIDDLISFSRTGRAELKKSTLKMNRVVDDAISQVKTSSEDQKVKWNISALPEVYGDYNLLRLVWINLIDNALKYTRNKNKAVIQIGYKHEKREIIFYIQDNGVGFDMKYAGKLFGVFQRLHSSSQFEGTGIGLANVQRIILRHGGKTWAEAETDKGATFYFSIPKEM